MQKHNFKQEFTIQGSLALFKSYKDGVQWLRCGEFWPETTPKMKFFMELKSRMQNTDHFFVEARLRLVEVQVVESTEFVVSVKFFWKIGSTENGPPPHIIDREKSAFWVWEPRGNNKQMETTLLQSVNSNNGSFVTTGPPALTWTLAGPTPLIVGVEVSLLVGLHRTPELPTTLPDANDTDLSSAWAELLSSGRDSDVVVVSAEGQEFPAHRLVLTARSPVFDTMLKQDMMEAREGRIPIDDFSAPIIKHFLNYLYTGHIIDEDKSFKEHSKELLAIADKYDVGCLKQKMEQFLAGKLNVETAIELLCLEDAHHTETLTSSAAAFIRDNIGSFVPGGEHTRFAKERPHLLDLILQ